MIPGTRYKPPRTRPHGQRTCERCGIDYTSTTSQNHCRDCRSVLAYKPRSKK